MGFGMGQPKAGCSSCNADVTACPGTNNIPDAANGLNGYDYNGFTVRDSNSNVIQQVNIQQGDFRVSDYLNILIPNGKGEGMLPLFTKMMDSYQGLTRLLFDQDTLYDEKFWSTKFNVDRGFVFKEFKEAPALPSTDGVSFFFTERKYEIPKAYVFQDATATDQVVLHDGLGNPIDLSSPKYSGEFEIGTSILVDSNGSSVTAPEDDDGEGHDCCSVQYYRDIIAIDSVVIGGKTYPRLQLQTLNTSAGTPISLDFKGWNVAPNAVVNNLNDESGNLYKGDRVISAFKTRNDCDPITGGASDVGDTVRVSYIQHFGKTLRFQKFELNKSYADPKGAAGFVIRKIGNIARKLVREMGMAFYVGQNRAPKSGATFVNENGVTLQSGSQAMGLLPELQYYNFVKPELGLITSMKNLNANEEKAALIIDQLVKVQQSGVLKQGDEVVMLMDERAYSMYMRLTPAFNRLMGAQYVMTNNVTKEFVIPEIVTPRGKVSIYTCPLFQEITGNSGNILFIPKKLVMLTQRENQSYSLENGTVEKASLGMVVTNKTMPGVYECVDYDIRTEFAIILGLVDSGSYRWLQNVA